ncbi:hypothetical protein ACFY12_28120 [Streptomyces sp. NPDC001339]|uniref:hypothetical protein n=1 Tax=Streptomyces sp. NPDC001339 TaxID=3364563 RepID=UPI00369C5116
MNGPTNGPWRLGPGGWVREPPPRHPEAQRWQPAVRGRARESVWLVIGSDAPPLIRNLRTDVPCRVDWRADDTRRLAYLDVGPHRYMFVDSGETRRGTAGPPLRVFRYAGEVDARRVKQS